MNDEIVTQLNLGKEGLLPNNYHLMDIPLGDFLGCAILKLKISTPLCTKQHKTALPSSSSSNFNLTSRLVKPCTIITLLPLPIASVVVVWCESGRNLSRMTPRVNLHILVNNQHDSTYSHFIIILRSTHYVNSNVQLIKFSTTIR